MKKNEKIGELLLDSPLWAKNQAPIWIASNFLLRRNLSSHLFPCKMSKNRVRTGNQAFHSISFKISQTFIRFGGWA